MQLKRGLDGGSGDPYELHADAVADRVVRSESAEDLLDAHAGPSAQGVVQRKAETGDKKPGEKDTEEVEGSLWAKDPKGADLPPSLDDLGQGQVGDCYLFATMACIVNANPDLIKKMIVDHGDRTYTVTFKGNGLFSADKQTVTADFAKGKHGEVQRRKALWPLIIEKAYAKEHGGLNKIGEGGNPGDTVEEFTNKGPEDFDPHDKPMAWVLKRIAKAHEEKRPTIVSSPGKEDAPKDKIEMTKRVPHLRFHHAYTVVDVDVKGQRIKLFNPWGYDHPNNDGWVNMMVIMDFFVEVDIN